MCVANGSPPTLLTRVTKASRANSASSSSSPAANLSGTNTTGTSELRQARCARIRDGVADVGQAAHVHHQALKAQAEAGVWHGAIAAQVPVPLVVVEVQAELPHARIEDVQAFLALA